MNILTVDDESEIRDYLKDILESDGHMVVGAENVKEGLDKQIDEDYDLLIMDLNMPQINGKEVIDLIRARRPDLPIIILSGHVESENELLELGATRVLLKPVEMHELLTVVKEYDKPA